MKLNDITINEEIGNRENEDLAKAPAPGDTGDLVSSAQAAKMLGVSQSRIRQMVMDGELKSNQPAKGRRDHMFKLSSIKSKKENMKGPGRPEKSEADQKDGE